MDDVHLHAFSLSVDDAYFLEALPLTFEEIVLQKRRDLPGRKSVKIKPVLDGNANRHKIKLKTES